MEKQSEIKQLGFPDNIRQNPQMMLGNLSDASLLYREILDNARDELIASENCNFIWLKCDSDFHIVADNGRGINVALSETDFQHRTQMELAVGELYAGGKYDREVISGGMHGIGSSAVNAVSNVFKIACKITSENYSKSTEEVRNFFAQLNKIKKGHTGYYLFVEYQKGIKKREYIASEANLKDEFDQNLPEGMSTIVGFTSDDTIVESNKVNFQDEWLEYTEFILKKFYNKDVFVTLNGNPVHYDMKPYKYELYKKVELAHPDWAEINKDFQVYITFEFDHDLQVHESTGCVNLISVYKGLHIQMAEKLITKVLKAKYNIEHDVLTPGLKVNVILLAKKVGYDSQTKVRLVSIDGYGYDDDIAQLEPLVYEIFSQHEEEIQDHVKALNELAATYQNLSNREWVMQMVASADVVGANRTDSFKPIKLRDATAPSWDRGNCELFLAEGSSAGGTIYGARDPYRHAVMPLRGVSLNTSWIDWDDVDNEEIIDIVSSIGTGIDGIEIMDNLRYNKIIIATDADKDGLHISALLLGVFASFMKFMVEKGHVYILESPLYKQDGKFLYKEDFDKLDKTRPYERFKGLGSLDSETDEGRKEINEIFFDDNTRHLIQVTPEDMELALAMLGDKNTRNYYMKKFKLVEERAPIEYDTFSEETEEEE
jgi:DNA gyrase subunit B